VVQFSGHGALIEGKLYLLPHEVDPRTAVELKDTALAFDQLREELLGIAQHGRVLVLLDACHSGTATIDGAGLALDAAAARGALAAPRANRGLVGTTIAAVTEVGPGVLGGDAVQRRAERPV
jgi:uncharacterized caspase-like protein